MTANAAPGQIWRFEDGGEATVVEVSRSWRIFDPVNTQVTLQWRGVSLPWGEVEASPFTLSLEDLCEQAEAWP